MKTKILHLSVALALAVLAGGIVGLISYNRDALFEWQWVKFQGAFSPQENLELRAAARKLYQEKMARPGQVCVDQWIGKDDRYLYMAIGCAKFEERLGAVETSGDSNYIPTRFRYDGKDIEHFQQPDLSEFENSIKKLFPREAYHLLAVRLNEEQYRQSGNALANGSAPSAQEPAPVDAPLALPAK